MFIMKKIIDYLIESEEAFKDVYDLYNFIPNYEYPPDIEEEDQFLSSSDSNYFKIVKTVNEAERFNYHSDYWGSDEGYQEENVELLNTLEPEIKNGTKFTISDEPDLIFTVVGVAIDTQYNSISHTKILVKKVEQ